MLAHGLPRRWFAAFCLSASMLAGCSTLSQSQQGGAVTQLEAMEQARLQALAKPDGPALRALLSDDYMHVHTTGKVEDRDTFVKGIVARPRVSVRGELKYRLYGNAAVITGAQTNQNRTADGALAPTLSLFATQVAVREQGAWRLVSMQATTINGAGAPSTPDVKYPAGNAEGLTKDQADVIALEGKRSKAIAEKDFAALSNVLADDYMHVYGNGRTSDRAGYIKEVQAAPRVPVRGPLKARIYGDVAVLSGSLLNTITYPDQPTRALDTFVTQVAHKANGQWKFVSFQITQKTGAQ